MQNAEKLSNVIQENLMFNLKVTSVTKQFFVIKKALMWD